MTNLYSKILKLLEENEVDNASDITGQLCGLLVEEQRSFVSTKTTETKEPSEIKVKKERKKSDKPAKLSAWMFFIKNSADAKAEYKRNHKDEIIPTNSMQFCKLIWDSSEFDKLPFVQMALNQ